MACRQEEAGLVCYRTEAEAERALALNGAELAAHRIGVTPFDPHRYPRLAALLRERSTASSSVPQPVSLKASADDDSDDQVNLTEASLSDGGLEEELEAEAEAEADEDQGSDHKGKEKENGVSEVGSEAGGSITGGPDMGLEFENARLLRKGKPILFNFRDIGFATFHDTRYCGSSRLAWAKQKVAHCTLIRLHLGVGCGFGQESSTGRRVGHEPKFRAKTWWQSSSTWPLSEICPPLSPNPSVRHIMLTRSGAIGDGVHRFTTDSGRKHAIFERSLTSDQRAKNCIPTLCWELPFSFLPSLSLSLCVCLLAHAAFLAGRTIMINLRKSSTRQFRSWISTITCPTRRVEGLARRDPLPALATAATQST
jgi:hypothetical protein